MFAHSSIASSTITRCFREGISMSRVKSARSSHSEAGDVQAGSSCSHRLCKRSRETRWVEPGRIPPVPLAHEVIVELRMRGDH